jgi:hypothetical protein
MLNPSPNSQTPQPFPQQQPERSRAVFCQEDFELIRTAISHFLQKNQDRPDWAKYSNLHHRLGRLL